MATTKTWNTRRLYTNEGQVIVATRHDDGVVTFMDHSRGVSGELNEPVNENQLGLLGLRDIVMSAYDHNRYSGSQRARMEGMYAGGCNRRQDKE